MLDLMARVSIRSIAFFLDQFGYGLMVWFAGLMVVAPYISYYVLLHNISYLLMAVSLSVLSALDELHKNNTPMYS